ncbi:MAG: hypothetical protein RLZZ127_1885, partial [Planctomycetota bacterium]
MRWCVPVLAALLAGPAMGADLLADTLPLRAALHEDPSLEAPLTRLVEAWRGADRLPELVAVYRSHCASFPQDASAVAVLVRLLRAAGDPQAGPVSQQALTAFPGDPFLAWLRAAVLTDARDPQALDALARAVDLEAPGWRRDQWIEQLVQGAIAAGRRDLAAKHLKAQADGAAGDAAKVAAGRRLRAAGMAAEALAVLDGLSPEAPPEVAVDGAAEAAAACADLGRRDEAASRLDALLGRLAADHWRRAELTRRRLALAGSETAREALLAEARGRADAGDEAAVLDYARLLAAADRRRDALAVLERATATGAGGARLEQELLGLHARVADPVGLERWLAGRIAAQGLRPDLLVRQARVLAGLGRDADFRRVRDAWLDQIPAAQRADRLRDLARDLRQDGRTREAADCLQAALAAAPERTDLRRELGEALIQAGDRARAEDLMAAPLPADAPPEQVLDAIQFLIQQRQWRSARRAIDERLAADPGFFELRLLAVRCAARQGDARGAEAEAATARPLADTPARYRAWADALVGAAGDERAPAVIAAEAAVLAAAAPDADRSLALAEAANGAGHGSAAADVLLAALARVPAERRSGVRRRLVEILQEYPARAQDLQAQLADLEAEDPALARECRVRTLLARTDAGDELQREAARIDPATIADPRLVARIAQVLAGDPPRAAAAWARLVVLEPAVPAHWDALIVARTAAGDRVGLRAVLRRLLAGVENLPLDDTRRRDLLDRLAASCWDEAAERLAAGDWQAVLDLVDEAEPATAGEQRRWIAALRRLAAGRLGRDAAYRQAGEDLERLSLAASSAAIVFPDGFQLGDADAAPVVAAALPAGRTGPTGPLRLRWVADLPGDAAAVRLDGDHVLAVTGMGTVVAVDAASGRRRAVWVPPSGRAAGHLRVALVPGGAVAATDDGLEAWSASTGAVRWRSRAVPAQFVLAVDGRLLAWNDTTGLAWGIDPADGRVRWQAGLPEGGSSRIPSHAGGPDGVVLLGRHAAALDPVDGRLRWGVGPAPAPVRQAAAGTSQASSRLIDMANDWWGRHQGQVRTTADALSLIGSQLGQQVRTRIVVSAPELVAAARSGVTGAAGDGSVGAVVAGSWIVLGTSDGPRAA